MVYSDGSVVLRTDFSHNNFCRRPLVKDSAGIRASKHRNNELEIDIL